MRFRVGQALFCQAIANAPRPSASEDGTDFRSASHEVFGSRSVEYYAQDRRVQKQCERSVQLGSSESAKGEKAPYSIHCRLLHYIASPDQLLLDLVDIRAQAGRLGFMHSCSALQLGVQAISADSEGAAAVSPLQFLLVHCASPSDRPSIMFSPSGSDSRKRLPEDSFPSDLPVASARAGSGSMPISGPPTTAKDRLKRRRQVYSCRECTARKLKCDRYVRSSKPGRSWATARRQPYQTLGTSAKHAGLTKAREAMRI
jgi:hypothetical protein